MSDRQGKQGWIAHLERWLPVVPFALFAWCVAMIPRVADGQSLRVTWAWVPSLGVDCSFSVDGLGLLFASLITGIGGLVFLYAPAYFHGHPDRHRLYGWLLLFMAAMLGLVLADNVVTLFVFWELTTVSSYMLVGFKHGSRTTGDAALQALLVTGLGGLALLAGLVLLGHAGGSYELSELLAQDGDIHEHPLAVPMMVLILLGAFTKSAQWPFHFWLPGAMQAPTPVSAYLHSATMVKAGVYLVARLSPAFSGTPLWDLTLICFGAVTALTGGWLTLRETDLKLILAYSTVSSLGAMMLLLGVGSPLAVKASLLLLLCHALYKGALFLVAGTIDHGTGTRDLTELSGLFRSMPLLGVAAILAGSAMAGLPPAGGFLAKELAYKTTVSLSDGALPLTVTMFLVSVSFVAVAGLAGIRPFFGGPSTGIIARPVPFRLVLPPLALGLAGLAVGLMPTQTANLALGPAVAATSPTTGSVTLKLWHGFNLPLVLSIATLATGIALGASWHRWRRNGSRFRPLFSWGPTAWYEGSLRVLSAVAAWQTRLLQEGRLRVYLLVVLVAFIVTVGFQLAATGEVPAADRLLDVRPFELFIPVLILGAALLAVTSSSRLAAVCALGVIGYALAMLFAMFGAPDLAMTQLAVETLTVILFVFVLYRLPRFASLSAPSVRIRDGVVAIVGGCIMTAVVLTASAIQAPSRVSQFYLEKSLEEAKGGNVVNVILVDFRALDTLGELTVLAIAALGILALMRLRPSGNLRHGSPEPAPPSASTSKSERFTSTDSGSSS